MSPILSIRSRPVSDWLYRLFFNSEDHLSEDDNVDVLMKMLEEKIRENERRFQEKRERRERQKQSMRAQTEKRAPTPVNGHGYRQQQRFMVGNASLNAAKQSAIVIGQRKQFMANSKMGKRDKRRGSRWDEKR